MKLTQIIFALVTSIMLMSLFLPSTVLLYQVGDRGEPLTSHRARWRFDGLRYILSPYTPSTRDPLGYNVLLEVTFFRTVPSYLFERPTRVSNFGTVQRTYDRDFLKSFAKANGVEGIWDERDSLSREAEATGYNLNRCDFLSGYSLYGIVLPVAQPQPHFISLLEAGEDYIYAFDPLAGRVLYPCKNFLEVWEGAAFFGRPSFSKRDSPVQGS